MSKILHRRPSSRWLHALALLACLMLAVTPVFGASMGSASMGTMNGDTTASSVQSHDIASLPTPMPMQQHSHKSPCCGGASQHACACAAMCAGVMSTGAVTLASSFTSARFNSITADQAPAPQRMPPLRPPRA